MEKQIFAFPEAPHVSCYFRAQRTPLRPACSAGSGKIRCLRSNLVQDLFERGCPGLGRDAEGALDLAAIQDRIAGARRGGAERGRGDGAKGWRFRQDIAALGKDTIRELKPADGAGTSIV